MTGQALSTGMGLDSGSSVLCSAANILRGHRKSLSLLGSVSLCTNRRLGLQIQTTRKAAPEQPGLPTCTVTVTLTATRRMWSMCLNKCPSDSSRSSGSLSQGKGKSHRTSMALGQGTAFFTFTKTPNALQSQVRGYSQGLEPKYQRQSSTWFSCSPKNFVEIKNYRETCSKHAVHHKTRCLTSG